MVVFNATSHLSAHIAAEAVISDADVDGVTQSMMVSVRSVHEGDSLSVHGCSSSASEVCHLQLVLHSTCYLQLHCVHYQQLNPGSKRCIFWLGLVLLCKLDLFAARTSAQDGFDILTNWPIY